MQPTTSRTPPVVTADGAGVVSHAGTVLLAELADRIGLTAALSEATDSLRSRRAGHDPGRVLVDVAVAIADGARTISDVQVLADQQDLHGPAGSVASTPTIWRVLDGIDEQMLAQIRLARAAARDRAWLARGELTGAGALTPVLGHAESRKSAGESEMIQNHGPQELLRGVPSAGRRLVRVHSGRDAAWDRC